MNEMSEEDAVIQLRVKEENMEKGRGRGMA
jgi:hypothetical protein